MIETITAAHDSGIDQARDLARRYAGDVRHHFGRRLADIRLFGSAARGDWTPASDIDVLVLLDRVEPEDAGWLSQRACDLGLGETGLLLQPLFMNAADFALLQQRERRFALEVERDGLTL